MDYSKQKNQNRRLLKGNHNEKLYSRVWLYVLRVICVAVLVVTFAVAGVVLGTFLGMLDGVPEVSLQSLTISRETTSIVDAEGNHITDIQTAEQRTSIPIEQMPKNLLNAVVAIEDARFYQHSGIDLEGILRAGVANLRYGGTAEGGSTITQQMIKKMVLTSDQTWKRKIQEWYLALQLEYKMNEVYGKTRTKELILESYLNYNFLGNRAYGVEAAAKRYFGKHASEMTLSECAIIAGLFNAPALYDPIVNYNNLSRERQLLVLNAMLDQGYITQQEYQAAKDDNVYARIKEWNAIYVTEEEDEVYSYFVDSAISQAQEGLQEYFGYTEMEAYNALYYGGFTIHITQDPRIQGIVDDIWANEENFQTYTYYQMDYRLTLYDEKDPNITDNYGTLGLFKYPEQAEAAAAEFRSQYVTEDMVEGIHYVENLTLTEEPQYSITVIDQHTGHVVALAGGRGKKETNMSLNRAIDSTRQPGSTFKILASYAGAIDAGGMNPGSVEDDAPFTWGDWSPHNWYGESYRGFQTLRDGVRDSLNIVTARAMEAVGVDINFDYMKAFGITSLREEIDEYGNTDMVGSLCLGSGSVSNIELCGAYATIANEGQYIEPILYTKITDKDGNLIMENVPETHHVIKKTTAWLLTDMMKDVVTSGTGTICNFDWNMAIAGKTGSTSDYNDFSFVGFTPYYTCAVMSGFDYVTYPEQYYNSIGEYSVDPDGDELLEDNIHKYLWRDVMEAIHEPLETVSYFAQPEGLTQVTLCRDSGKLAGPYCSKDPRGSRLHTEWCAVENVPNETCDRHVEVEICKASLEKKDAKTGKITPQIANEYCPAKEKVVFIQRSANEIEKMGGASVAAKLGDGAYMIMEKNVCTLHDENYHEESSELAPLEESSSGGGGGENSQPAPSTQPPNPNNEETGGGE